MPKDFLGKHIQEDKIYNWAVNLQPLQDWAHWWSKIDHWSQNVFWTYLKIITYHKSRLRREVQVALPARLTRLSNQWVSHYSAHHYVKKHKFDFPNSRKVRWDLHGNTDFFSFCSGRYYGLKIDYNLLLKNSSLLISPNNNLGSNFFWNKHVYYLLFQNFSNEFEKIPPIIM